MKSSKIFTQALAIAILATTSLGCSRSDKNEDTEDEDSTVTGSGTGGGGTVVLVSGLTGLPNVEDIIKTSSQGLLSLTATGTPPKFAEISPDNMEQYLVGDLTALVSAISAARQANNWAEVKSLANTFRDGLNKCRIMEDSARQLSNLTQSAFETCMMSSLDKPNAGILVHRSGEKVPDGEFFAAGSQDTVRVITLNPTTDKKVVVQIPQKTTGTYRAKITVCEAGAARNGTLITMDESAGSLSYEGARHNSSLVDLLSVEHWSHYKVSAFLESSGVNNFTFDSSRGRDVSFEHKSVGNGRTYQFVAGMNVTGDLMTTKLSGLNQFTSSDNSLETSSHKGISTVKFTGTKATDAVIYEGAGKYVGKFERPNTETFTHEQTIGFNFNENETPQYQTDANSSYLTSVTSANFATDPILSQSTLTEPDITLVSDSDCALAASSTYTINGTAQNFKDAEANCQAKFPKADSICRELANQEHTVWSALRLAP